MNKCSIGKSVYSVALAMMIALCGSGIAHAQVSVNAPSGLTKRSNAGATAKKAPATQQSAPAAAAPAEQKAAQPKASKPAQQKASGGTAASSSGSVTGLAVTGQYSGYRVQVLFSSAKNGRAVAQERARKIARKYPQYRAYMSYVAPRWRLRFGDFKTIEDARYLANRIKSAFPEMRADVAVVTDKVNKFK
ncbi:MAG: SPOR domain-containing protein [Bacteroidales bacterium]|nr:SPOR domain-containing protein [Bacteroidales bacterium]